MEKFLLLIREDLKRRAGLTPEEFQVQGDMVGEWIDKMAADGNFLNASALHDFGNYVNKTTIVSDGPFIEAKESVSGFILIQANSLEHATELAQACPFLQAGHCVIEVRPLQFIPDARHLSS